MKALRFVALYLVGLVALIALAIAGGLLQESMIDRGFAGVFASISRAGWVVLVGAIVIFVADMIAMTIYTIRHGASDRTAGRFVSDRRALPLSLGQALPTTRSKRKSLGGRERYVTMQSLVDGTATTAERMMVAGIVTAIGSFFLIFVGISLILTSTNPVLLGFMIVPGLWAARFVTTTWRGYRRVRAGLPEDPREQESKP